MADEFSNATQTFLSWFTSNQPFLSPKIKLADLRDQGKGRAVVALQDLDQDEELFSVSRKRILSTENSDLAHHPQGQGLISTLDDQWLSLILVMIYEYLRGQESPWKPYFDVLPPAFNTLMFWSEDELAELQTSSVREKIGKTSADKMFSTKLTPAIRSAPDLFPGASCLQDDQLLALAHRMGSTIMAYAFDIEKDSLAQAIDEEGYVSDEEADFLPKGMVPMADMLNADASRNNARLFYEADIVSMRTLMPVKAGEELFNDYGPLPRGDLLRRYGYITENYAQYDVAEIPTSFVVDVIKTSKTAEDAASVTDDYLSSVADTLDERGYYEDAYDISSHSHVDDDDEEAGSESESLFPQGLQMLLYRLLVDNNSSAPAPTKYAKKPSALTAPELVAIHKAYIAVLQARQAQYGTSIEQDRQALRALGAPNATRQGMALQVRLGEKVILQKALEHANAVLESTTSLAEPHDDRAQKRTKTR